jgi:hypothetical protein
MIHMIKMMKMIFKTCRLSRRSLKIVALGTAGCRVVN